MFRALGIVGVRDFELTTDADGAVRVRDAHPDKARIEAAFARRPDLARRYRTLAGLAGLLRAADAVRDPTPALGPDPGAPVERLGLLADDSVILGPEIWWTDGAG